MLIEFLGEILVEGVAYGTYGLIEKAPGETNEN